MKWTKDLTDFLQAPDVELRLELARLEALRAIAEQLELAVAELTILAAAQHKIMELVGRESDEFDTAFLRGKRPV